MSQQWREKNRGSSMCEDHEVGKIWVCLKKSDFGVVMA